LEFARKAWLAVAPQLNHSPRPWSNSFSVRTVSSIGARGGNAPGLPDIG